MDKRDEVFRIWIKRIVLALGIVVVAACCLFQFFYYRGLRKMNLSGYNAELEGLEYSFEEINYMDPDNDFIRGYLSLNGSSTAKYPTRIVFYIDDSNVGYSIPVKLSNVDTDGNIVDGAYNEGLYADKAYFDVLIDRFSGLRNKYKIAFLIDFDGQKYLIETNELYKYSDI